MSDQKPGFADIADLPEDTRIDLIGRYVLEKNKTASVITDDEPGKPERYVRKLQERFPGIKILSTTAGPVANTVIIMVAPPKTATT